MCPLFSELRTYMIETKKLLLGQTRRTASGSRYGGEVGVGVWGSVKLSTWYVLGGSTVQTKADCKSL